MKTVSTAELAQRVALDLAAPEATARAVLDHAIDVMKQELQRGNNIELPQFISVLVKTGQPAGTQSKAGVSLGLPAVRQIQMNLDETLRKAIEGSGLYKIMLAVPKKNFFTSVMASRLASARSEVTVVAGEEEALAKLGECKPDLIVLDVGLSGGEKICEAVKQNRKTAMTAIVQICSEGQDPNKVIDLAALPDEHIAEPFELTDLVKLSESELSRFAEERNYFEHEMRFRLQTKEELVERANDIVLKVLEQSGLTQEAREACAVAFREAIDNAARHGNRSNENRYIDVQYLLDREKVTVAVTDEGDGFDTEVYLSRGVTGNPVDAARERNDAGGAGGLGIMLMLKCVDKLEYNYVGNKISLTRYIRKA
jgi:anti-sigma regulatory factor (Ser/Thr protein kinase)/nucleoid DNA-binding protein